MKQTSWLSSTADANMQRSQKNPLPMSYNCWQEKWLARKPDFRVNLDNTMKQLYASQLYDHSIASIAKALLLQMPTVSFTQYRNELARVLGTHQHPVKGVSSKAISATPEETESEGKEKSDSKSQWKQDRKISAQSSQNSRSSWETGWGNSQKYSDPRMAEPRDTPDGIH